MMEHDFTMVLALDRSFNPARFFHDPRRKWKAIISEVDRRAEALKEVDFARIGLETCLKHEDVGGITGVEKLARLKESGVIRLGVSAFLSLWREEGHITLKWLNEVRGVTHIDFMGTVLKGPDGKRRIMALYRYSGGWWLWRCRLLEDRWYDSSFTATLAK